MGGLDRDDDDDEDCQYEMGVLVFLDGEPSHGTWVWLLKCWLWWDWEERTRRGIFTNMMEAYCLLFMWDDTRKCLVNIFEENLNFEETFFQVRWYLVRKRSDKDEKKHQELHLWRIHLDQKEWKFFCWEDWPNCELNSLLKNWAWLKQLHGPWI